MPDFYLGPKEGLRMRKNLMGAKDVKNHLDNPEHGSGNRRSNHPRYHNPLMVQKEIEFKASKKTAV